LGGLPGKSSFETPWTSHGGVTPNGQRAAESVPCVKVAWVVCQGLQMRRRNLKEKCLRGYGESEGMRRREGERE